MIKAYWWQGGPGRGNFGDQLTRRLCERLSGQAVEFAEPHRADILAIGSVLEPHFWQPGAWTQFRGFIWGTGRMFGNVPMDFPLAKIVALRGRLSWGRIGCRGKESIVLGDPGLLCPMFARPQKTRYKLGIVPHWSELRHPLIAHIAAKSPEIAVIDMCGSVEEVLDSLSACQYILASALHGLVSADALGIPNEWLRLNTGNEDRAGLPEFKYRDYYSVWGLERKTYLTVRPQDTLESILTRFGPYARPGVSELQKQLLEAFPFQAR